MPEVKRVSPTTGSNTIAPTISASHGAGSEKTTPLKAIVIQT